MDTLKRNLIEAIIDDLVADFFYYDRKEDDEVTVDDMENLTDNDIEFICETFTKTIQKHKGE